MSCPICAAQTQLPSSRHPASLGRSCGHASHGRISGETSRGRARFAAPVPGSTPAGRDSGNPAPELGYKRISIGEVAASMDPMVLQTLLGSCVAVCLRDPDSGAGGMNHILLPGGSAEEHASRFGVQAMELLINELMKLGADRRKFVAKAFGAGNVLSSLQHPTVGDRNAQFVRAFLAAEGVPLLAERLGGNKAVQVRFNTGTGKAIVRSVDGTRLPAIIGDEEVYRCLPRQAPSIDAVTLF